MAAAHRARARRRRSARRSSANSLRLTFSLPGAGERRAVAPEPGLHDAVELVDAEGDRLDHRRRVADAHQVARPIGGQVRRARQRAPAASRRASPRPTARRCRSRRSRARPCAGRSRPACASLVPPCTMPNSAWSVAVVGGPGPGGPRRGALDGERDDLGRARQRRAHVEHHLDVGAEQLLGRDRRLGREAVASSRRTCCGT